MQAQQAKNSSSIMISKVKTSLRLVEDIRDDYLNWNAWNQPESFPINKITNEFVESVSLLCFSCLSTNPDQCDELWDQATKIASSYLVKKRSKVLFIAENSRARESRIRSFKGVVAKEYKDRSIQIEHQTDDGSTIIGGLIDLRGIDGFDLDALTSNCPLFFILSSDTAELYSQENLQFIMSDCVSYNGRQAYIDYANLISSFVEKDAAIIRFGGDGGDKEVSVQLFIDSAHADIIKSDWGRYPQSY